MYPLPVDPTLDEQRRLRVLVPILGEKSSYPVPPPALDGTWDLEMGVDAISVSASVDLGVSAAFKGATSVNRKTLVWNALIGKRAVLDNPTADSAIFETFWGVGLRVVISFVTTEISTDVDVAVVAASADFKSSDVQYEVHAVGLGPSYLAKALREVPPLGRFDLNTYWNLDGLRQYLAESLVKELPQSGDATATLYPLRVSVSTNPFQDVVNEAAVYRFVMMCVAAGLDLAGTQAHRQSSVWKTLDARRVDSVFQTVTGGTGKPTPAALKKASNWLVLG